MAARSLWDLQLSFCKGKVTLQQRESGIQDCGACAFARFPVWMPAEIQREEDTCPRPHSTELAELGPLLVSSWAMEGRGVEAGVRPSEEEH